LTRSPGQRAAPSAVLRVGLTGGIATGKSEVGKVFSEEGAFLLDADALGHELMMPGTEGYREIRQAFGEGILAPDSAIDRGKLGTLVFRDSASRLRLNEILHPLILEEEQRQIREFARRSPPGGIAVTQAALLVEAGVHESYDRLVVTHCSPETQIRRLLVRDGLSEDEAASRIKAQGDPRAKIKLADYLVDTTGSLDATRDQARRVYEALRQEWESRRPAG